MTIRPKILPHWEGVLGLFAPTAAFFIVPVCIQYCYNTQCDQNWLSDVRSHPCTALYDFSNVSPGVAHEWLHLVVEQLQVPPGSDFQLLSFIPKFVRICLLLGMAASCLRSFVVLESIALLCLFCSFCV